MLVSPAEKNAKLLIGVLVRCFPLGATSGDLRVRFEDEVSLRNASFYAALRWCKDRQWIVGGGKDRLYQLNSNGDWKEALRLSFVEEGLERDRLECVVELQTERIERLEITGWFKESNRCWRGRRHSHRRLDCDHVGSDRHYAPAPSGRAESARV